MAGARIAGQCDAPSVLVTGRPFSARSRACRMRLAHPSLRAAALVAFYSALSGSRENVRHLSFQQRLAEWHCLIQLTNRIPEDGYWIVDFACRWRPEASSGIEFNLLGVDPGEVAPTVAETIEACFRNAGVEVEVKVVASQARL